MSREKTLGQSCGLESTHMAFSLQRWLMRDFRTVVLSTSLTMGDAGDELAPSHAIAGVCIRHQLRRGILQPLQQRAQEAFSRTLILVRLDEPIQHITVLVHSPPERMTLPA